MQTPAEHNWDCETAPLVESDPTSTASEQQTQPVKTEKARSPRKPRKSADQTLAAPPFTEGLPLGMVLNLPNAQGNFRISVVDGELLVKQETKPIGQLGGVTRQAHILSKKPADTSEPAPEKVRAFSVEEGALHIRLSGRALFFTFFCLVWTLVLARFLGAV